MKILHASDNHGNWKEFFYLIKHANFDMVAVTGDNFPYFNPFVPPPGGYGPYAIIEQQQTQDWVAKTFDPKVLKKHLGSRPMIEVLGNHDAMPLTTALANIGYEQCTLLTPGELWTHMDVSFAGFHCIPNLRGHYNYAPGPECQARLEQALELQPDVLLTHAPAAGRLSYQADWGFKDDAGPAIEAAGIKYHMFGHIHECAGMKQVINGTTYINGACNTKLHKLET